MARVRIQRLSRPELAGWLLTLGLLLAGLGGAFLPWVWREPVALQLTAPGLAEFVKFLPQVRYNQIAVQRLFFLLPLFLALLALPLLTANHRLALPLWLRRLMGMAVIPLALAALSPVWTPTILAAPEFRLQTLLAGGSVALVATAPLWRKLPLLPLLILLLIGGLAALVLPWWQFSLIQPGLTEAYHQPVALGWGWWLTAGGLVLSLAGGLAVFRQWGN